MWMAALAMLRLARAQPTECNTNTSSPRCELRRGCTAVRFLSPRQLAGQPIPMGFDVFRSCEQDEANLAPHLRLRPLSLTERDGATNESVSVTGFAAMSQWNATLGGNRFELAISDHAEQADVCRGGDVLCFDMRVVSELLGNDTLAVATTISRWDWSGRNNSGGSSNSDNDAFSATYQVGSASIVGPQLRVREIINSALELQLMVHAGQAAYELRFAAPSQVRGQWSWQAEGKVATVQLSVRQAKAFVGAAWTFSVRVLSTAESNALGGDAAAPSIVAGLSENQVIWIGSACGGAALLIIIVVVAVVVVVRRRRQAHTQS